MRETPHFDDVGIAVFSSMPAAPESVNGFRVKRYLRKPTNLEEFLSAVSHAVLEIVPKT